MLEIMSEINVWLNTNLIAYLFILSNYNYNNFFFHLFANKITLSLVLQPKFVFFLHLMVVYRKDLIESTF